MNDMNVTHGRRGSVVEYAAESGGGLRLVAGRLRYSSPPELGTIVGPKDITREHLVVLGVDGEGWTLFGYATDADLTAAITHATLHGPRSLNERIGAGLASRLRIRGA